MAAEEGRCERCPLYTEDPQDSGQGRLCASLIQYPVYIEEGPISVCVETEESLAEACTEWTARVFQELLQRPAVTLHPRALLRFRTKSGQPRPRSLCPHSWPMQTDVRLALEQITMDASGMQVRYLHNELPWLEQPAIYTDVFMRVQGARAIFREWDEARKSDEPAATGQQHQRPRGRSR